MADPRIGFIGYGRHARNNLYPSLNFLGTKLTAIATTSTESSTQAANLENVEGSYSNYLEMLKNESLDAVIISTPPSEHVKLTMDCLEAGCHVFVEKPLGLNANDAETVMKQSKSVGKHVMVGFMKRYAPAYQRMYEIIADKRFGELVSVNGMFGVRNFADDLEDMLMFAAIHYADMLVSVIGEVEELNSYQRVVDGNFALSFVCRSKSGVIADMAFIASQSWGKLNEEMYITGTGGYIHVQNGEKLNYHFNPPKSEKPRWQMMDEEEINARTVTTTSGGGNQSLYQKGFIPELEHFLKVVSEDVSPLTSASENYKTMKFADMLLGR